MSDLTTILDDSVPGLLTDVVAPGVIRVVVPTPRGAHEYVTVIVESIAGGWLLSDAGEVARIAGAEVDRLAHLLLCAGAEIEVSEGVVTSPVSADEPLASRVLSFAHELMAAPMLWYARDCLLDDEAGTDALPPESPSKILAKQTRQRLVERVGRQAAPLIALDRRVFGRGESVRAPLAIMPPASKSPPLLVAAFVDTTASDRSVTAAKKVATWTFEVVHEFTIPKYLVVRGGPSQVAHFESFYDNFNISSVPSDDGSQLEADALNAVSRLGFGPR
jgi:hypothetical protein